MSNLTIDQIKRLYAGVPNTTTLYDDGRVNLMAIRANERKANRYDDRLYAIRYRQPKGTDKGGWEIKSWVVTVDPGLTQLTNPTFERAQKFGTAILCENHTYQFEWSWIGGAKGHTCLKQNSDVWIYQDHNFDGVLDFVNPVKGKFSICVHAWSGFFVNNNSAGCTDFQNRDEYKTQFLPYLSRHNPKPALTPYTLFTETQMINAINQTTK